MPDPCKDEEIENRTRSLCLFDVVGITILNRCSNCPGAARSPLQHKRCPRDSSQPNIYRTEDPDSKTSAVHKSLASTSKQHESVHEVETVLPDRFARLSLVDSGGTAETFGRSEADLDIPGGRAELPGTPRISHGLKRKAKNEFDDLGVQDYLKLKALKPFHDLEPGNLFMPGCWHVRRDEMTALMNSSAASPMDTQEDRPTSSRPFVAGCCLNTERDECGLVACNDGIETEGCEVLASLDEMEF